MTFFVVPSVSQPLLGRIACEKLGLIKRIHEINKDKYTEIQSQIEYADVFDGLGCLPGKHSIVVDPTVQSVVNPCRKVPFALQNELEKGFQKNQ